MAEAIEDAMRESPLSVEVRSGWYDPCVGSDGPEEFCILLSTGGPALRIVGELNDWAEPARCWMEHQDWGTPWTRYFSRTEGRCEAIKWFASLFHYGED